MPVLLRCFFLLVILGQLAAAQELTVPTVADIPPSEDYVLRGWEIADGLPSNRVLGIAQTPDGYIWLATSEGLARFDGARFTPFWEKVRPGREPDRTRAVFVSRDGALWFGLDQGGVARWLDGRLETVLPVDTEGNAGAIISFAQDEAGSVWFGSEGRALVFRRGEDGVSRFSTEDGLVEAGDRSRDTSVATTKHGRLWFSNATGCGPFDGKRFQAIDPQAGGHVHLAPSGTGGMWAIRARSLIHYHADGRKDVVLNLGEHSVHVLCEDAAGTLWMGTNNAGLIGFRDGVFTRVQIEGSMLSLFEDRDGDLWVGTSAGGVYRLHPRRFFLRQRKDGLIDDETYSLCEDTDGRLWLSGRNRMLVRSTGADHRSFATPQGWTGRWGVMAVHPDPAGGVWLGTLGGLVHLRDGVLTREALYEPLTALLADRRGTLWAATTKGALFCRREGEINRMPTDNGLVRILALAEDVAGAVWAGTAEGRVFRREAERFAQVPIPGLLPIHAIRFIVPDGPDTVWIGALEGGLYRWRNGQVARLPDGAGFPVNDLRSLAITPAGDFWIGTGRGLFHAPRSEVEAFLEGRTSVLNGGSYGRDDGLPTAEFALGFRGATTKTHDGRVWFATMRGALEIRPFSLPARMIPRSVLIDEIWVGDALFARDTPKGELELPSRPRQVKISYTLPQLSETEGLCFRYRLMGGSDEAWVENGNQRVVTFADMSAGSYRFGVAAREASGTWLPGTAAVVFTVQAAWWETAGFRVGAGLVGLIMLVWLVRKIVLLRVRARIRRLEQGHAIERERARIARDMHDELGANLTHIRMISQLAHLESSEAARARLVEISAIAGRTVKSLDEIVWAVNPLYDTLAALIEYLGMFAATFLASAKIACETDLPRDLPSYPLSASVRYHLFLAVKEALHNAVKHADARLVRLQAELDGDRLRVIVSDDGRGFAMGDAPAAGSDGLRNLRARMAELNGECDIESLPGRGTRVVFMLRLSPAGSGLAAAAHDSDLHR
jgi:signal transduction histidine kinase/ligand-binding sensor domain-containing protein